MSYDERLIKVIDELLAGGMSYDLFHPAFYDYFHDEVPDSAMSDDKLDFFCRVAEKMEYVDTSIDDESRTVGYITPLEFIAWLQKYRRKYRFIF